MAFCAQDGASRGPVEGDAVTLAEPLAATPDARRASDNFASGLWAIRTSSARDLGRYTSWPELALLPGTRLTVLKRTRFGETPVTVLVEGGGRGVDARAVLTEVATGIRRATADRALTDLDAGRYGTDLRTSRVTWDADRLSRAWLPVSMGDPVSLRLVEDDAWHQGIVEGRQQTGARDELVVELGARGRLLVTRADGESWDASPEAEVATRVTDGAGSPHRRAWLRVSPVVPPRPDPRA